MTRLEQIAMFLSQKFHRHYQVEAAEIRGELANQDAGVILEIADMRVSRGLPTHAEVDAYYWEQFKVKGDGTYSDALWATLIKFGPRFTGVVE